MKPKVLIIIILIGILSACGSGSSRAFHRILFIGNSLTLHGPSPQIGWAGNWGMAASEANKDYVHQLAAKLGAVEHAEISLYGFETNYRNFDLDGINSYLQQQPDLIVIQLGDNVSDVNEFPQYYDNLVNHLSRIGSPLILCTSTWWNSVPVNEGMKSACSKPNIRYVDISSLHADVSNVAGSERPFTDAGVASHPGDKGMAAIADALFLATR